MTELPPELRNILYEQVLPLDRDVYYAKTPSDIPWDELAILRLTRQFRDEAGSIFYGNMHLVLDPTAVVGRFARVKQNIDDTLRWLTTILRKRDMMSVTLILNGNIWRYWEQLWLLAELVRLQRAACFVNGIRFPRPPGDPTPTMRVNILVSVGHPSAGHTLAEAISLGNFAREQGWTDDMLRTNFISMMTSMGDLPTRFPRTSLTTFDLPNLRVHVGPGDIMYSSAQGARNAICRFRWLFMSQGGAPLRYMAEGGTVTVPLMRVRVIWIQQTLIPALSLYRQSLQGESHRLWATINQGVPLQQHALNTAVGFGSWSGVDPNRLSVNSRLGLVWEELAITNHYIALMTRYPANGPVPTFGLTPRGIRWS